MAAFATYLAEHRFAELFRDELGWDRASGTTSMSIEERPLCFEAIAQKRGLQVLQCIAGRRVLLNKGLLRQAQRQIARSIHEHIVIYACNEPPKQVWQWSVRLPDGRRLRHREHPFFSSAPPGSFVTRLGSLRFSLDEEADATLVDALDRVRVALDVSAELNLFAKRPSYAERSDELAVAMRGGDAAAFHKFIVLHMPLARHISKRLQRWFGMDAEEAEQIGVIGLIQAARRFDPQRGYQFSTYATHWVRQACQRFGPDAALFIRLPSHIIQPFFTYRRHLEQLTLEFGPVHAREELLLRCLEDKRFHKQWQGFERALGVRSLSDRAEPEYRQACQLVDAAALPHEEQLRDEQTSLVRAAIDRLKPRHRKYLRLRYGIDCEPQTLEEIGKGERLTRERVRQVLMKAEERLRYMLHRDLGLAGTAPSATIAPWPSEVDARNRPAAERSKPRRSRPRPR